MSESTTNLYGNSHNSPAAIAKNSASVELAKAITDLKTVSGFGFSTTPKEEQARVLRVLADQVEKGAALIQAVTFEEMTSIDDFVMFRWSIRFAERQSEPITQEIKNNEA